MATHVRDDLRVVGLISGTSIGGTGVAAAELSVDGEGVQLVPRGQLARTSETARQHHAGQRAASASSFTYRYGGPTAGNWGLIGHGRSYPCGLST
jgi:hypothetical protein